MSDQTARRALRTNIPKAPQPDHQTGERGATTFIVAIVVVVVLLAGALAVDLSIVATRGQSLQNAADSAALAGVQAMRESIEGDSASGGTADIAAAQAAAGAAVANMLSQNGIDSAGFQLDFPDPTNNTAVSVTLTDTDPGTLLTGVTGVTSDVERSATAEFESCSTDCFVSVPIPSPFSPVDMSGSGDGFIPTLVGNKMYALNHHQAKGSIVCVDLRTQSACWPTVERAAYASGYHSVYNPDDPLLLVQDDMLFWVAGDAVGTKIYCWNTVTDTPCSQSFLLNDRAPEPSLYWSWLTHSRASGPTLIDGKIYVLTDDHRMHCVTASIPMTNCSGYGPGGSPTELAIRNFPENRTQDGNNGDGNFPVVHDDNGKIYTLTQVKYRGALPVDCSVGNMASPSGRVMIQNAHSGEFLRTEKNKTNVTAVADSHYWAYWDVENGPGGTYRFRNVYSNRLLGANSAGGSIRQNAAQSDFELAHHGPASTLELFNRLAHWQNSGNVVLVDDTAPPATPPSDPKTQWIIQPFECFDVTQPTISPDAAYAPGTWIQCWDTNAGAPCLNFTASQLHSQAARNSGRLFFHRNGGGVILGLCSFGLNSGINLRCVDDSTGARSTGQESALSAFSNAYLSLGNHWFGVPYYHEDTNRLFVPSAYNNSHAVCWDFSSGLCGVAAGLTPSGISALEYGYLGVGDCIVGLGHRSVFRAFDAVDIYEPCSSSTTQVRVNPCNCSGDLLWGNASFDIDLSLYSEFTIAVTNSAGEQVFPPTLPDGTVPPPHSLFDGTTIDLSDVPIAGPFDYLDVEISVMAPGDPWAVSEQRVEMTFGNRRPRLTD